MADQERLRIDRVCSGSSKEKLSAGDSVSQRVNRTKFGLLLNFERMGRLAVIIPICFAALLVLAVVMLAAPAASSAEVSVGISVSFAPPAIPVYEQPPCPGVGYIWTPGYWAWDPDYGYFWVPGTWVLAPFPGALWTPGYWGWSDGVFVWYEGYWGPVVGFYGGINYGFGYTGLGYDGGYWRGGAFYYNKTVNNINLTNITNVYSKTVVNVSPSGASFNGGTGGTTARPTPEQLSAAKQRRSAPVNAQRQQQRAALADPKQRASVNQGKPGVAATQKPGRFTGRNVIPASRAGAPYKAPPGRTTGPGGPAPREERREVKPQERRPVAPERGPAPKEEKKPEGPAERPER